MPASITAICISNSYASTFLSSNLYSDIKPDIYIEKHTNEGLFLAMSPSRDGYMAALSQLDSSHYLCLDVDEEDDLGVTGSFIPPKEVNVVANMSIVANNIDKEQIENNIDYYNYDFLKNLNKHDLKKLKELIFENDQIKDLMDDDVIDDVEELCPDYDWDDQVQKWAFFELGFDTSLSTDSTFILKFQPSLRSLIRWKDVIEDELDELQGEYDGDNFAYSLHTTENYDLLQEIEEQLQLDGDEALKNYPSIIFFGFIGNIQSGWEEQ